MMFSNFIYFIVVVLIYTTYQPAGGSNFSPAVTLLLFLSLIVLFTFLTRSRFNRLISLISDESISRLDDRLNTALMQQSVMAIVLFAINIYGLNLPGFFAGIPVFNGMPTLLALIFIGLFIAYLSIVWACAHDVQQRLYRSELSKGEYVLSNISFSIPVLLPWFLVSGIADLINILPFELPKRMLATTEGEVVYFLTFLLATALLGPAIIQKFWRCIPLETGEARNRIESLCRKAGVAYNNILYWPIFGGRMITAGVMGLVAKFRYILVTRAMLQMLDPIEVDAVIGHEIGHVKKKHLLFYLLFFAGYMLITYALFDLLVIFIYYIEPLYRFVIQTGIRQTTLMSTLMSLIVIINFIIYFRYVFGYFMRNFERQADAFAFSFFGTAEPLISTFEKITRTSGRPPDRPNWHHFSISERIQFLKNCEIDNSWVTRHDRKIKKSIAVYLTLLVLIGGLGYHLNFGKAGTHLNHYFSDKIIQRELERSPDNPELYSILGDLEYSRKRFEAAARAYEKALELSPDNPRVLNNLAWLYATCEDERFRDPETAVYLSEKAASLETAPHIWDTLAESYYANRDYEKAVNAGVRALSLARENRSYYKGQLKKFRLALKKSEIGI